MSANQVIMHFPSLKSAWNFLITANPDLFSLLKKNGGKKVKQRISEAIMLRQHHFLNLHSCE